MLQGKLPSRDLIPSSQPHANRTLRQQKPSEDPNLRSGRGKKDILAELLHDNTYETYCGPNPIRTKKIPGRMIPTKIPTNSVVSTIFSKWCEMDCATTWHWNNFQARLAPAPRVPLMAQKSPNCRLTASMGTTSGIFLSGSFKKTNPEKLQVHELGK